MSKKVIWEEPKAPKANLKAGHYSSYKEFLQKAQALQEEQRIAQEYLKKALPVMSELLRIRLKSNTPLIVMRPLNFQTSKLSGDGDDGFYKSNQPSSKFVDVIETILPGTQLRLKSLDTVLNEFVFEDALNKEYAINFSDRNLLLTQTDIFETTKKFFEERGE